MQIRRLPGKVLKIATEIVLLPVKLLFFPSRLIFLFYDHGVDVNETNWRSKFKWRNAVGWILTVPIRLLFLPFSVVKRVSRDKRASELLFFLPALLWLGCLAFIAYQLAFQTSAIKQRYLNGARRAVASSDPQLAKKYFQRVIENGDLSVQETYQWAAILRMSGDTKRADQHLASIAPDDAKGYPPAHQVIASQLADHISKTPDKTALTRLKWHLQNSGDPTPASDQAWAAYWLANNRPQQAIDYLKRAAKEFPQLYLVLADLCETHSLGDQRIQALQNARSQFEKLVQSNPLDQSSRVALSRSLLDLNEPDAAEKNLLNGLQIFATPELKQATCDFYVLRFDRSTNAENKSATASELSLNQQFELLSRALAVDPEYLPPFLRLARLSTAATQSQRDQIKSEFLAIISGKHSTALAHICLAHLFWQTENLEEVRWHLDQAWGLDDQFGAVASVLALAFASAETPDLDWAVELANESVIRNPDVAEYQSRREQVSIRRQKFRESAQELEKGLTNRPHKSQLQ